MQIRQRTLFTNDPETAHNRQPDRTVTCISVASSHLAALNRNSLYDGE